MSEQTQDKSKPQLDQSVFWKVITDPRMEWSVRYTVLLSACYAVFFFPPYNVTGKNQWIDWSLPVQLASGGNLAFYNMGWNIYFGIGCAYAMAFAGCMMCIIFPFLQQDQLGAGYVILLTMLSLMAIPVVHKLGVLNNTTSLTIVLFVIFTEVFYGPVLNLRHVLPDQISIWTEVVRGNAVPSLVYAVWCVVLFSIPPWHFGRDQSNKLVAGVLSGISDCLGGASTLIEENLFKRDSDLSKDKKVEEGLPTKKEGCGDNGIGEKVADNFQGVSDSLRSMARTLFAQTNYAGLEVAVSIYGEFGLYEFNPTSMNAPHEVGHALDALSFHVSVVLYLLGSDAVMDELKDLESIYGAEGVTLALVEYLKAASRYVSFLASLSQNGPGIACDQQSIEGSDNQKDQSVDSYIHAFRKGAKDALDKLKTSSCKKSPLLYTTLYHLTEGNGSLSHSVVDKDSNGILGRYGQNDFGTIGRMADAVNEIQPKWKDVKSWIQIPIRLSFLEQLVVLFVSWCQGVFVILQSVFTCSSSPESGSPTFSIKQEKSIWKRRGFQRGLQFLTGTWALYAMATWWDSYRTLLGSSSTGQWTMVAFYVCFRSTAEETVNAAILRTVGHGLGAAMSYGVNSGISESGSRMAIHLMINLVLVFFIPPPFCYPSKFTFKFDVISAGVLEGLLTTYHLTSVLVFSTDIASATQARALSQCIGSLAAAAVSLLIFPNFASSGGRRKLDEFQRKSEKLLHDWARSFKDGTSLKGELVHDDVEDLLQARREWNAALEAKGWIWPLLDALGLFQSSKEDENRISEQLTRTALQCYALEGISRRITDIRDRYPLVHWSDFFGALTKKDMNKACFHLREGIESVDDDFGRIELSVLYLLLVLHGEQ